MNPRPAGQSECRSCRRPIVWVNREAEDPLTGEQAVSRVPLEPAPEGNLTVEWAGELPMAEEYDPAHARPGSKRFVDHRVKCPGKGGRK